MKPIATYPNIDAFYRSRGGERSVELDFGVWHTNDMEWTHGDTNPKTPPVVSTEYIAISAWTLNRVRVSVVIDTGDVYAVHSDGKGAVALLGSLRQPVEKSADSTFSSWADSPGPGLGRPLSWFARRLQEANEDER